MEELINLYNAVTSFSASCGMNNDQKELFYRLNRVYNREAKSRNNYSICNKQKLISTVELYLTKNGYTFN